MPMLTEQEDPQLDRRLGAAGRGRASQGVLVLTGLTVGHPPTPCASARHGSAVTTGSGWAALGRYSVV
ncbi:hypothetical protein GCM10023320_62510 [Pseudonocardia adelaidensis]|uniref:Uncharacterized protein n=1 Tax=Pseudonocardia adelaidensis TaxID=648754 RepID=A0ABP9NY90_9PSEU